MSKKKYADKYIKDKIGKFDEKLFIEELLNSMSGFNEKLQLMINEALKHAVNKVDFFHIYEWLTEPEIWLMPMVSLDTFLNDPHYLGGKTKLGTQIYEKVREVCRDVVEGGYTQAIELAGIGAGKSFSSQIMACYLAHKLLCMRDCRGSYGLALDKPIVIVNMGLTSTQALDVVFSGIKTFIYGDDGKDGSPFFMQFNPIIQAANIKFKKQGILLFSGNSKVETVLGYNVYAAILDEAAFYLDNDSKSAAKDIFDALQARIISRCGGGNGLVMGISSPRYEGDFITEKVATASEVDRNGKKKYPHIYAIQLPTWKVKGEKNIDMEGKFYFDVRKGVILEGITAEKLKAEGRNINFVLGGPIDNSFDVREIPGDFLSTFQENPEKAKRDYGATPTASIAGYFTNIQKISDAFDMERKNPIVSPGIYNFGQRPLRTAYFIGIDIGFNKDGKGDHCGFCMGHGNWENFSTVDGKQEYRMNFHIDLMERIAMSEDTGEVDLGAVRQRIYDLRDLGYSIKLVSFDQYASKDFRQIIEKKGFKTEYISVDRTTESYDIVKQAIYEGRLNMYYNETVERELKQLEIVKGTKIDHPPKSQGGSKDVSDALAQVCTAITFHTPRGGLGFKNVVQEEENPELRKYRYEKMKEKYYEKIIKQVEKQEEARVRVEEMEGRIKAKLEKNLFF